MEFIYTIHDSLCGLFSFCQALWSLRERLAEGLLHDGYCYKYDVSLPLSSFYQLVVDMRQRVSGSAKRVVGYGHVGDGELGEFGEARVIFCIELV